ncbi:hypothetical protein G7046_g568 [Stylonectria norvegica]|nr:hypothetical protein G7046_g568 [Stylonectria norvegica]
MAPSPVTKSITLFNSVQIPQLGFGVYESPVDVCVKSCLMALETGYRHIDTAQYYANEREVGQAIQQSSIPRKDVFLTTKILSAAGSVEQSYRECVESVAKLDPEQGYVDLFLIHSPNSGKEKTQEMWLALERLYQEGKAKSIGVSNFGVKHIEEMKQFAKVWPPHVNQIEVSAYLPTQTVAVKNCQIINTSQLHPWLQQPEIVKYCEKNNIAVEAYCPLVRNMRAEDKTLVKIAEKHNVSPNQVLIRFSIQKNWIPLPKSDNAGRIQANADVFNFQLDGEDMSALNDLDMGDAGAIVQAVDN